MGAKDFSGELSSVPKNHRRTPAGRQDTLVRVAHGNLRAAMREAGISNRETARRLQERGLKHQGLRATLDYLTQEPPMQQRARRSVVTALAALWDVPAGWLMGKARLLPAGMLKRSPAEELVFYRLVTDITMYARQGAVAGNALMALAASPEHWRSWLLPGSPALSLDEAARATEHLARAFRIILAPFRVGKAKLNRAGLERLARLWPVPPGGIPGVYVVGV
jgi:hypothetical protein